MKCAQQQQERLVLLYAHGQLTGVQRWLVEGHLRECAACRAAWARCVAERDSIARAARPLPAGGAVDLTEAVRARARSMPRVRPNGAPSGAKRYTTLMIAAAILAIALSAAAAYVPAIANSLDALPGFGGHRGASCQPEESLKNAPASDGTAALLQKGPQDAPAADTCGPEPIPANAPAER